MRLASQRDHLDRPTGLARPRHAVVAPRQRRLHRGAHAFAADHGSRGAASRATTTTCRRSGMPRWSPAAPSPSAGVSSCACSRPAVCGSPSAGTRGCCTRRPSRRGCLRAAGSTSSPHARTDRPPALPSSASGAHRGRCSSSADTTVGSTCPAVRSATRWRALGELQREVLGDQEGAELVGYVRNTVPPATPRTLACAAGLLRGLRPGG